MSGSHEKVELMYDVRQGTPHALFIARVVDRGLPHVSTAGWATSARSLEPAGESLHRVAGDGGEHMLAERAGTLFHVGLMSGWVHVLRTTRPRPAPSSTGSCATSRPRTAAS